MTLRRIQRDTRRRPRAAAPLRRAPIAVPDRSRDRVAHLADGRRLGYTDGGDPGGRPLFFFHGFGTTRLICPPDDVARTLAVRLIAVDRPGIGLSDPQPGRRLLDWPRDVAELADQLGIRRFGVIGWSGGAAYAAACGYMLPDRVTVVGLISGPAPLAAYGRRGYLRPRDRTAVHAAGRAPWVIRLALWHWGRPQRRDPVRFFETSIADMIDRDRAVMAEPSVRAVMIENSVELYRQGGRGMYDEALVLARPWGFRPEDLRVPVVLWHGDLDETVPPAMARHMASSIPDCRAIFYPDEGHHFLYTRWPEIVATLAS